MAAWRWGFHSIKLGFVDRNSLVGFPVCFIHVTTYGTLIMFHPSFDPIFVLPVINEPVRQHDAHLETHTTGRRTGTGSAAISRPTKPLVQRVNIAGFCKVSLLQIITCTGRTPLDASSGNYSSLEEIRSSANRPVVVFPECTTSNGRGLLRFAEVFKRYLVPVKGLKVFVMCIRCVNMCNVFRNLAVRPFSGMTHPHSCFRHYHIPSRRR